MFTILVWLCNIRDSLSNQPIYDHCPLLYEIAYVDLTSPLVFEGGAGMSTASGLPLTEEGVGPERQGYIPHSQTGMCGQQHRPVHARRLYGTGIMYKAWASHPSWIMFTWHVPLFLQGRFNINTVRTDSSSDGDSVKRTRDSVMQYIYLLQNTHQCELIFTRIMSMACDQVTPTPVISLSDLIHVSIWLQ